jgi:hypothetical protein
VDCFPPGPARKKLVKRSNNHRKSESAQATQRFEPFETPALNFAFYHLGSHTRMPVTYVLDTARKLIRTTCSGPITLGDVVDHFRTLADDPACAGRLDVMLDVRETASLPKSIELKIVNSEVAAIRAKVEFGMCAIVATGDPMFGMMRMFAVFAERNFGAIGVFREAAGAEEWLTTGQTSNNTPSLPP